MRTAYRCLVVFGLLLGLARAAERDIVRTFPMAPGGTLTIDTYHGNITVTESDQPEIRVAVHLEIGGDTEAEAEEILRGLNLAFTANQHEVTVVARDPAETGARFVWNDTKRVEPTYRVTVPTRCNLRLRDRQGNVVVGNVNGDLSAKVEHGDVFFRHVGGFVTASTEDGDLVISQCDGAANVHVMRGTIRLGVVSGHCEAVNTSGGIEIMAAKGGLRAHAEAGGLIVGLPRDVNGAADVSTSGGSILLNIDPAANCEIDASASVFSHVDCRLPLKIQSGGAGRRKLIGQLNQGGVRVVAHASGGNVSVLPGQTAFE